MEITIAVLAYLFHCFTAFAHIFSYDIAKIWGDLDEDKIPSLHMPQLNDIESENVHIRDYQKYIDNVISPAALYFRLLKEIDYYQSKCKSGFSAFLIQAFSLLLCCKMLIRIELFDSWIITIIFVTIICSSSCLIMRLIYNRYWRCQKIRIKHFKYNDYYYTYQAERDDEFKLSYENKLNNIILLNHYNYLYSIRETVCFRYHIRKILDGTSMIIFLLFFPLPEY